jgi:hypothetical protein
MNDVLAVEKASYPIVDFLEWQRQGRLDLNPPYQRRQVWNPRIKSKLIDTLIRGYPIPLIFLHNRLDVANARNVRQVVDGQQRLRTILSFIDKSCLPELDEWDDFTVLRAHNEEYSGLPFSQFPDEMQTRILQTPLSVNVLPADVDDVTVLQIFQRINSTGLKLNNQELRNATYFGEFKDFSYKLAYEQHQRWLMWGLFNRQSIGQMIEVEFVADLLGLMLEGVRARTKTTLDNLYRDYDSLLPKQEALSATFDRAFAVLDEVFTPGRAESTLRRFRTSAWVYACFAVVTEADLLDLDRQPRGRKRPLRSVRIQPKRLVAALESADLVLRRDTQLDPEVAKTLRGATADRRSREQRISFIRSQL